MNKFLQLLSLCVKAGKAVSGEFLVEEAIKNKGAKLVIIAEDASDNTKKHFTDMCTYRDIPVIIKATKAELGKYTGKEFRANAAILDEGFAKKLKEVS